MVGQFNNYNGTNNYSNVYEFNDKYSIQNALLTYFSYYS